MAMQKIEELHTIVLKQGEMLEQRTLDLRNTAKQHSDLIAQLKARIQELEIDVKTQDDAPLTPEKGLSSLLSLSKKPNKQKYPPKPSK